MRHAAMLSSLEITGLVSPKASLRLVSSRETAMSRWCMACWRSYTAFWRWTKASAARDSETISPTLRAVRQMRWVRVVALRLASMYSGLQGGRWRLVVHRGLTQPLFS
jgi:hypothetical protein